MLRQQSSSSSVPKTKKLSRFVSSLKPSTRLSKVEEKRQEQEVQPVPRVPNRQRWHEEVKGCGDVLEFLFNNGPPVGDKRARSLSRPTTEYLRAVDPSIVSPSTASDQILSDLLDEHANYDPSTLCVAVLSCLHDLSLAIATQYIISLHSLEIHRYLRCVIVAAQVRPGAVSPKELEVAKLLLLIVSDQARGLQEFGQLVQSLAFDGTSIYLTPQTVHNALTKSWFRSHLPSQIQNYLDQQQFMTAFGLVSWLQAVTENPGNSNLLGFLDFHFQCWPWLSIWKPNIKRINVWEHGKISKKQRETLSDIFKLDGPDYETHKQSSLKLVEPQFYEHIKFEQAALENLERILRLLHRACLNGPSSVDFFIQQCVGKIISPDVLSMVESAVQKGEDAFCGSLVGLACALDQQSNLTNDVHALIKSVSIFENSDILEDYRPLIDQLINRLCNTMRLAQHEFCEQLCSGPGDYIGMLVHELGMAILQSSRISSRLPPKFLQMIKQFPQENTLEAIFDELQDDSESSAPQNSRLKTYLASSLGGSGTPESEPITVVNIQEEIKFWKRPPDILRKDFAKKLARIQGLDYAVYTKCLNAMLSEHDLYITDMKGIIIPDDEETGLKFATYLSYRRGFGQLQNDCWLLLTASLVKSQRASPLTRMADSASFVEWDKLIGDLGRLLAPIRDQLPETGSGLTRERMAWWKILSQKVSAVQFLLEMHGQQRSLRWLYFPASSDHIMPLLEIASQGTAMSSLNRRIISYLRRNGSNAIQVCDCIRLMASTSMLGQAVCKRFLSRDGTSHWTDRELYIVFAAWSRHESLRPADRAALESVRLLLRLPLVAEPSAADVRSTTVLLQSKYEILFGEARELESIRLRLHRQNPKRVSFILSQIGIENVTSGRILDDRISGELIDAIEEVGDNEYELSFPLTSISSLQRQARGIKNDSRMLLIRLSLRGSPQFCIHFSPNDEGQNRHRYWRPFDSQEPPVNSCTTKPNLFTYYLGHHLHHMLRNGQPSMKSIYDSIQTLITAHPTTCLVCSTDMGTKLWKPGTCSVDCSKKILLAPLEVQLHNLLVDPTAIDLLLTSVYAAARDTSALNLLPDCPVQKHRITTVIDTLPALSSFQTTSNLRSAIQGSDGFGKEREDLLSWICLRFRGFILSTQSSFRVPSMPNTYQFLMLNTNHERELLFNAQATKRGNGRVVFHGTQASRLFLILTQGLKVMSNTPFMLSGAARGAGIYCGDDQLTSFGYTGGTGASWKNSALGNMRVLLGCELATTGPSGLGNYHVVANENSLAVRYIFLLPANYRPPPRHHVEPAMAITYANLRSGTLV